MNTIYEFAPAKINLYLHATGRRVDGYHNLDSLVGFADIGDKVILKPAEDFRFDIIGPMAEALSGEESGNNLVVKAARSLSELTSKPLNAHLVLVKNLPVASGIGGGSSDAAATLRALARFWGLSAKDDRIVEAASLHGQDVAVCLAIENKYITETGVLSIPDLPRVDVVLVNPGKALSTPLVYKEYRRGGDAFSPMARFHEAPQSAIGFVQELKTRGNDLYVPACRLMPEISEIINALASSKECLLARMSGSGATCFGLFPDARSAQEHADRIQSLRPEWWVKSGVINTKKAPQI